MKSLIVSNKLIIFSTVAIFIAAIIIFHTIYGSNEHSLANTSIALAVSLLITFLVFKPRKHIKIQKSKIAEQESELIKLKTQSNGDLLIKWIKNINSCKYESELEVEIKFITPLLINLGWNLNNTNIRNYINISAGRQELSGVADWLLFSNNNGDRKNVLIIEAKGPHEPLDISVKNQARSYAFSSKTKHYMITNSKLIEIYELKIDEDRLIFKSSSEDLEANWHYLKGTFDHITRPSLPPPLPRTH